MDNQVHYDTVKALIMYCDTTLLEVEHFKIDTFERDGITQVVKSVSYMTQIINKPDMYWTHAFLVYMSYGGSSNILKFLDQNKQDMKKSIYVWDFKKLD